MTLTRTIITPWSTTKHRNGLMKILIDRDVAKLVEFMERNIPRHKMRRVSIALAQLAELLWARSEVPMPETFTPFQIYREDGPHVIDFDAAESPQQLDGTQGKL